MAGPRMGITATLALALTFAATAPDAGQVTLGEVTLGKAAAASGRYVGAALDPNALDERAYRDLAATELTSVTPENAMKWGVGRAGPGRVRLDRGRRARRLRQGARAEGSRPHARLAFAIAALAHPGPFSPRNSMTLMVAHIAAEAGRYKGAIYAWDVVNEPFADDGELAQIDLVRRDGSRLCRDRASRRPRGRSRRQPLHQRLRRRDRRAEDARAPRPRR